MAKARTGRPAAAKQADVDEIGQRMLSLEDKLERLLTRQEDEREERLAAEAESLEKYGDDPHAVHFPDDAEIRGTMTTVTLNVGGRQVTRSVPTDIAHRVHQRH